MPEFQPKSFRFACRGMNLNRPIDAIPEGQYEYLKNVRSYVDGRLESRPGLEVLSSSIPASGPGDYIHSGCTVVDSNPDSPGGPMRFIGFNDQLWAGPIGAAPVTFIQIDSGYSGNPLSLVPASSDISPIPWLYVYDSLKQKKYSSTFAVTAGKPDPYPIGLATPWSSPTGITKVAGSLTGRYFYRWRLRDSKTGVISQPGPPTGIPGSTGIPDSVYGYVDLATQSARFTLPAILDPSGTPYYLDVFRYGGIVNRWALVASGRADGVTVITDNVTDTQALAAGGLDFTRFQPWVTQDIPRKTIVNVTAAVNGTGVGDGTGSIITLVSGDTFNQNWLPGTSIIIDGRITATLRRWISSTSIEVDQNITPTSGVWAVVDGALESGYALPHVWGPYGSGITGLYYFAVGDKRRPGTLVWTTANDPDSTNPEYSLDLTDASEPLLNGCMYNGRAYVWSTERMWEIIPDLMVAGRFYAQLIPGARGLWAEWALVVGDYMYWRGKDGVYRSQGGLPDSITDRDLYPLFPHDAQPAYTVQVPNPESPGQTFYICPPDESRRDLQRLCFGDGVLYYDYLDTGVGGIQAAAHQTLVYDTKNMQGGWVHDSNTLNANTSRYWESNYHILMVGVSHILYMFTGVSDAGVGITCAVMTGALPTGDSRSLGLIGDAFVGAVPNAVNVTARLLGSNNTTVLSTATLYASGGNYGQTILDVNYGLGLLNRTVGLWLTWSASGATVELRDWGVALVPKPEYVAKRATDWSDDGRSGPKWLMGCVIEANVSVSASAVDLVVDALDPLKVTSASHPFVAGDVDSTLLVVGGVGWKAGTYRVVSVAGGAATLDRTPAPVGTGLGNYTLGGKRTVDVQYDGGVVAATLTISHPGQTELSYAFTPVVARKMRLVPTDSSTCQILSVRWIWIEYPEYLPLLPDYNLQTYPANVYVRGVALEGDTQGTDVIVQFQYDGGTVAGTTTLNQSGKNLTVIGFASPFIAKELRVIPLRAWRRFSVRWIYDEYPDFAALLTPWMKVVGDDPKGRIGLVRGALIMLDTENVARTLTAHIDGSVSPYSFTLTANGQRELPVAFDPPIPAHLIRWVPNGPWRYWKTVWIVDEYAPTVAIYSPWVVTAKPRYYRGVNIKGDTDNVSRSVIVQREGSITAVTIPAVLLNGMGIANCPFAIPFVAYAVRLKPNGNWRYLDAQWDADDYPDMDTRLSPIISLGTPGAKFMQGMKLTSDTNNVAVGFEILGDGTVGATLPATAFNGKVAKPFSFASPFIAHDLQIRPLGDARLFMDEIDWVWEPAPDLATVWQTQATNHDIAGFHHHRDAVIAYQSAPGAVGSETLTITTENGAVSYLLPVSANYTRVYVTLQPQKARQSEYKLTSTLGARLFVKDTVVRVRGWGDTGMWRDTHPFGDLSRAMGARI